MSGKTSSASKNKYIAKTYDRINLIIRKDSAINKEVIQAAADAAGESLTTYIQRSIEQRIAQETK